MTKTILFLLILANTLAIGKSTVSQSTTLEDLSSAVKIEFAEKIQKVQFGDDVLELRKTFATVMSDIKALDVVVESRNMPLLLELAQSEQKLVNQVATMGIFKIDKTVAARLVLARILDAVDAESEWRRFGPAMLAAGSEGLDLADIFVDLLQVRTADNVFVGIHEAVHLVLGVSQSAQILRDKDSRQRLSISAQAVLVASLDWMEWEEDDRRMVKNELVPLFQNNGGFSALACSAMLPIDGKEWIEAMRTALLHRPEDWTEYQERKYEFFLSHILAKRTSETTAEEILGSTNLPERRSSLVQRAFAMQRQQ